MLPEFKNCQFLDFSDEKNRKEMLDSLAKVRGEFGKRYYIIIGGKRVKYTRCRDTIISYNPSMKDEVIGIVQKGTQELAEEALDAAWAAFESWKRVPLEKRVDIMLKARELLIKRRHEFNAWVVYEAGKSWAEADGEVAEVIDFLDFYPRHAMNWCSRQKVTNKADEKGYLQYIPLGVGAVVPPWNYPCAIPAGLIIASIVAGNTVVVKPASDTPVVGAKFVELLEDAGIPEGVVNYLPGSGPDIGEYLVNSPKTRFIAFTGSKEVGLRVYENLAKNQQRQIWLKRFIAEMGGKNAHIIDEEADLESAAAGTINAAFGYQGQKCSACSRAIVDEKVYDRFLKMLVEKTKQIKVGPSDDPSNYMGPVISQHAFNKIVNYINIGKREGKLVIGGNGDCSKGYFIEPTIFTDVSPNARIAQEEIFGPVLSVIRAKDYEHALWIANSTEYGLTGAVYTSNPAKLERAKEEFHAGNLYLNRKCTGALVGAHPFGGFNMSGTDSKTGGQEYVLLFLQAKTVAEKI